MDECVQRSKCKTFELIAANGLALVWSIGGVGETFVTASSSFDNTMLPRYSIWGNEKSPTQAGYWRPASNATGEWIQVLIS